MSIKVSNSFRKERILTGRKHHTNMTSMSFPSKKKCARGQTDHGCVRVIRSCDVCGMNMHQPVVMCGCVTDICWYVFMSGTMCMFHRCCNNSFDCQDSNEC